MTGEIVKRGGAIDEVGDVGRGLMELRSLEIINCKQSGNSPVCIKRSCGVKNDQEEGKTDGKETRFCGGIQGKSRIGRRLIWSHCCGKSKIFFS